MRGFLLLALAACQARGWLLQNERTHRKLFSRDTMRDPAPLVGFISLIHRWTTPLLSIDSYKEDSSASDLYKKEITESTLKGVEIVSDALDTVSGVWEAIAKGVQPEVERLAAVTRDDKPQTRVNRQRNVVLAYLYWLGHAHMTVLEMSKRIDGYFEKEAPAELRANYELDRANSTVVWHESKEAQTPLEEAMAYLYKAEVENVYLLHRSEHVRRILEALVTKMTRWHTMQIDKSERDMELQIVDDATRTIGISQEWAQATKAMINKCYALDVLMANTWMPLSAALQVKS